MKVARRSCWPWTWFPRCRVLQTAAWWLAWGGVPWFPGPPPERSAWVGGGGSPTAVSWREAVTRHCCRALAMARRVWWWPWDVRLDWHPSPGQGSEKEGPPCAGGCTTRPVGGSRALGEVGSEPRPLPAPSPHASPSEAETHRRGIALRSVSWLVPKLTGQGQWLHLLTAGPVSPEIPLGAQAVLGGHRAAPPPAGPTSVTPAAQAPPSNLASPHIPGGRPHSWHRRKPSTWPAPNSYFVLSGQRFEEETGRSVMAHKRRFPLLLSTLPAHGGLGLGARRTEAALPRAPSA